MSPQYTAPSTFTNSRVALTKARKMLKLQDEDPRYRNLDRLLARAYIELQKQKIQQRRAGLFTPRMDLCDDPGSAYLIASLEVPGTKADQLSVRIENGRLIVEGERTGPLLHTHPTPTTNSYATTTAESSEPSPDAPDESALYPVRELKYGKFRREIPMPPDVHATHVRSTLVEGMLTISWPRDPSSISINAVADTPAVCTNLRSMPQPAAAG